MMMTKVLMILISYLSGSIPFGIIIASIMGAGDIRKKGSGNIGATNVLRTTGKLGGAVTLLLDALKGLLPVLIAKSLLGIDVWTLAIAFAAIIGHNYTVFLKFRGGKGVATSFGVLLALWPYIGIITIGLWIGCMFIWKYSSLAALISFAFLPVVTAIGEKNILFIIFSVIISSLLFLRHKENIGRLIAGKEGKIGSGRSNITTHVLIILILSASAAAGTASAYDRLLPVEVERLWIERQEVVRSGNITAADLYLDEIVRTRYRLGINRIDDLSALIVREGYLAIEQGEHERANRLSLIASEISPGYSPSYYLSARSLRSMPNAGTGEIIDEYMKGIKASAGDFRTLFNFTGRLYSVIILAFGLTILVFTVSLCFRNFPIFMHTFNELTSGFINRPFNTIFFFIIACLPLLFGVAWFALIWIVITWIYMGRNEKIVAVICIVFFLSLPGIVKFGSIYVTAHDNISLTGLIAADRGYGEPALIEMLKEQDNNEPGNNFLTYSLAYLSNKDGMTGDSQLYYERLINSGNENLRINSLNSLGNINYYSGNYDKALDYYRDAMKESPESPIPVYNISQAYREKLLFSESDKYYEAAKKISIHDIERFTSLSTKGSGYRVIEYPLTMGDMWNAALTATEDSQLLSRKILNAVIRIPSERFPFLGISIGIILSVLSYIKPVTPMAYYCPACMRSVCSRCSGSKIFGGICRTCKTTDKGSDIPASGNTFLYFLIPGLWHLSRGHMRSGIISGMIFCTGISGLLSGWTSDTFNIAYYLPEWPFLPWLSLIILSYIMLFFMVKRPFSSGQGASGQRQ